MSVRLFHFARKISSQEALHELEKAGYRALTFEEFNAFSAANPELHKQFPIVGLATKMYGGEPSVFVLKDGLTKGRLCLYRFHRIWSKRYRFAGAPKEVEIQEEE